jgi:hypothetical protein
MSFASVYPMYLAKVKKKDRTRDELHQVIQWLTGFDDRTPPRATRTGNEGNHNFGRPG